MGLYLRSILKFSIPAQVPLLIKARGVNWPVVCLGDGCGRVHAYGDQRRVVDSHVGGLARHTHSHLIFCTGGIGFKKSLKSYFKGRTTQQNPSVLCLLNQFVNKKKFFFPKSFFDTTSYYYEFLTMRIVYNLCMCHSAFMCIPIRR